jgi:hypothetical protein
MNADLAPLYNVGPKTHVGRSCVWIAQCLNAAAYECGLGFP